MASSKKKKSAAYWKTVKEMDRTFEELNLQRPQDSNQQLLQRARQINFGLISFKENDNKIAIEQYHPPPHVLTPRNDFKCYKTGKPEPKWVDTPDKFLKMIERVQLCKEIALDLEMHNNRTLTDFVCLIQIGTWEYGDYLIDPIKVRDQIIAHLKPILESPDILKIGHDLTNDVKWLQKDFGIFLVAAIDTQIMYKLLHGEATIGFKTLASNYHPELKHLLVNETLSDWRLRPGKGMSKEQEVYATNDVHILLRIFDELRSEMQAKDTNCFLFYESVEETKLKLLQVPKIITKTPCYLLLATDELKKITSKKKNLQVTEEEKKKFSSLLEWRDLLSKVLDEKPEKVLHSEKLFLLCKTLDTSIDNIKVIIGVVDKRIYDRASQRVMQTGILQKILDSNGSYIEEMRNHECHNCFKTGHGPAWACPFPKIKEHYKAWFHRPENKESRHKQYQRRRDLLVEKFGEEKADQIIAKTKKEI